jgi:hypothetical protein
MKALKVFAILLLAMFSYSAVNAQTVHHRYHKRHRVIRHHHHVVKHRPDHH